MQWRKFTRLKAATGHSRTRRMLCCGRRKVSFFTYIFDQILDFFAFLKSIFQAAPIPNIIQFYYCESLLRFYLTKSTRFSRRFKNNNVAGRFSVHNNERIQVVISFEIIVTFEIDLMLVVSCSGQVELSIKSYYKRSPLNLSGTIESFSYIIIILLILRLLMIMMKSLLLHVGERWTYFNRFVEVYGVEWLLTDQACASQ